jgi:hypothetical protein
MWKTGAKKTVNILGILKKPPTASLFINSREKTALSLAARMNRAGHP